MTNSRVAFGGAVQAGSHLAEAAEELELRIVLSSASGSFKASSKDYFQGFLRS